MVYDWYIGAEAPIGKREVSMGITATTASASERAMVDLRSAEMRARQAGQTQALSVTPQAATNEAKVSPTEPSADAVIASARVEAERKQPVINANGQLVGSRVNTVA